jgi:hypothetical protein
MRNERRTSGSGMGAAETSTDNRATAPPPHFHPNRVLSEARANTDTTLVTTDRPPARVASRRDIPSRAARRALAKRGARARQDGTTRAPRDGQQPLTPEGRLAAAI